MLRKLVLTFLVVSTFFATTTFAEDKTSKEETYKCYLKLAKELSFMQGSPTQKKRFERIKVIMLLMKQDGFTCKEILKFILDEWDTVTDTD